MTRARSGLRALDRELRSRWRRRFDELPAPAQDALRDALQALRADAVDRAQASWAAHKAPMALYWKVVGVYAGHLARALRRAHPSRRRPPAVRAARANGELPPRDVASAPSSPADDDSGASEAEPTP